MHLFATTRLISNVFWPAIVYNEVVYVATDNGSTNEDTAQRAAQMVCNAIEQATAGILKGSKFRTERSGTTLIAGDEAGEKALNLKDGIHRHSDGVSRELHGSDTATSDMAAMPDAGYWRERALRVEARLRAEGRQRELDRS